MDVKYPGKVVEFQRDRRLATVSKKFLYIVAVGRAVVAQLAVTE